MYVYYYIVIFNLTAATWRTAVIKNLNLKQKAELLRILAHPARLAILEELSQGVKCVTDIRDLLEISQSNVSQHLLALRRKNVIDFHEDGNLRCYYITRPKLVKELLRFISGEYPVIERSAKTVRREGQRRKQVSSESCGS